MRSLRWGHSKLDDALVPAPSLLTLLTRSDTRLREGLKEKRTRDVYRVRGQGAGSLSNLTEAFALD